MDGNNKLTWKKWLILKKIATCKNITPTYKKKWAERIQVIYSDPIFSDAINILKDEGIATSRSWVANTKLLTIDINKLDKFIEKSDIYKEFKNYVLAKEMFVIGV